MARRGTGASVVTDEIPLAEGEGQRRTTLTSTLVQSLRSAIVFGKVPPGARLHIAALAEEHGVSLGVIREALSRLVPEGLVQALDQRGFRVVAVSPDALMDLTSARVHIEVEALRRSIANGDMEWEGEVLAAHHRLSKTPIAAPREARAENDEWSVRHRLFHRALISACGSEWLMRFHDQLFVHSERYRRLVRQYRSDQVQRGRRDVYEEHRKLMETVLARDADRATELIERHLYGTARRVIDAQKRGEWPTSSEPRRGGE